MPSMEKKEPTISITFDAPRPLVQKIEREMKELDRPRSWVIRQLLVKALESQREKATA